MKKEVVVLSLILLLIIGCADQKANEEISEERTDDYIDKTKDSINHQDTVDSNEIVPAPIINEKIKGYWSSRSGMVLSELDDAEQMKEIGINTITFSPSHTHSQEGKVTERPGSESMIKKAINKAHKAGFRVMLETTPMNAGIVAPKVTDVSLFEAVDSMARLRAQCIAETALPEQLVEEYFNLSCFLADIFFELADQHTINKLEVLVGYMNEHEALMNYDSCQRPFWMKHLPEFVQTLDEVLIQLYGASYGSLDQGHHIVSALKNFCARAEGEEVQELIFSSISPLGGVVRGIDAQNYMLFNSVEQENGADLVFEQGDYLDELKRKIKLARSIGYQAITTTVNEDQLSEISKLYPLYRRIGQTGGRKGRRHKVQIPLNEPPEHNYSEQMADRLLDAISDQPNIGLLKRLFPNDYLNTLFTTDFSRVEKKVLKGLKHMDIDRDAIEYEGLGDLYETIAAFLVSLSEFEAQHQHPIGSKVVVNNNIDDFRVEDLWTGSVGEILDINLSVLSLIVTIGKKRGRGKPKNDYYWEDEYSCLQLEKPGRNFEYGHLFSGDALMPGDIVEIIKVSDDDEFNPDVGSIAEVIGPTYVVKFNKIVDKRGRELDFTSTERCVNHAVIDVIEYGTVHDVHESVDDRFRKAIDKSELAEFKFESFNYQDVLGIVHQEVIQGYGKRTICCTDPNNPQDNFILLTYVEPCEKEEMASFSLDPFQDLVNNNFSDSAFSDFAAEVNPVYINMRVIENGRQINYLEGRR